MRRSVPAAASRLLPDPVPPQTPYFFSGRGSVQGRRWCEVAGDRVCPRSALLRTQGVQQVEDVPALVGRSHRGRSVAGSRGDGSAAPPWVHDAGRRHRLDDLGWCGRDPGGAEGGRRRIPANGSRISSAGGAWDEAAGHGLKSISPPVSNRSTLLTVLGAGLPTVPLAPAGELAVNPD